MWTRTAYELPPRGEILGVIHAVDDNKEQMHEEAIWSGKEWVRCHDSQSFERLYYFLWRRLPT